MKSTLIRIISSKTTWAAIATISAAISVYADGKASLIQLIQTVGGALLAACLRDTIATTKQPPATGG